MPDTLLGRLVLQFSGHPENLATEALAYLLESDVAGEAVRRRLTTAEVSYPADLRFTTQVHGEEGEIPDVVGTDADGVAQVVLEAKFWAELTSNQPVMYLRGVSGIPPRVLASPAAHRVVLPGHGSPSRESLRARAAQRPGSCAEVKEKHESALRPNRGLT